VFVWNQARSFYANELIGLGMFGSGAVSVSSPSLRAAALVNGQASG